MLRIAICDDEQTTTVKVREVTERFFKTHCTECDIKTYRSAKNLQYDIMDSIHFDLLLLDIEMPEVNGMALAELVHNMLPGSKVIFITSHLEFAVSAYEFAVFRYIPKIEMSEKLNRALEDFYKLYQLERNSFYTVSVKNRVQQIPYRDILYILKEGKYTVFHIQNHRQVFVRKTLAKVYEEIGSEFFYFADRGCIINLANVTGMDGENITVANDENITISQSAVGEFKTVLLRFSEKQI